MTWRLRCNICRVMGNLVVWRFVGKGWGMWTWTCFHSPYCLHTLETACLRKSRLKSLLIHQDFVCYVLVAGLYAVRHFNCQCHWESSRLTYIQKTEMKATIRSSNQDLYICNAGWNRNLSMTLTHHHLSVAEGLRVASLAVKTLECIWTDECCANFWKCNSITI